MPLRRLLAGHPFLAEGRTRAPSLSSLLLRAGWLGGWVSLPTEGVWLFLSGHSVAGPRGHRAGHLSTSWDLGMASLVFFAPPDPQPHLRGLLMSHQKERLEVMGISAEPGEQTFPL